MLCLWTRIRFSLRAVTIGGEASSFCTFLRVGRTAHWCFLADVAYIHDMGNGPACFYRWSALCFQASHCGFQLWIPSSWRCHDHLDTTDTRAGLTHSTFWRICPRSFFQVSRSHCGVTLSRDSSSEWFRSAVFCGILGEKRSPACGIRGLLPSFQP